MASSPFPPPPRPRSTPEQDRTEPGAQGSWGMSCCAVWVGVLGFLAVGYLEAAITPAQRKEINDIKKDLGKVSALISKKDTEDATKILNEAETKLKKIVGEASVTEDDKAVAPVFQMIATKGSVLEKKHHGKDDGAASISFSKDVSPILAAKCGELP